MIINDYYLKSFSNLATEYFNKFYFTIEYQNKPKIMIKNVQKYILSMLNNEKEKKSYT
jgi:hypothetical protein